MLLLHQLPLSWLHHPLGICLLVLGVCGDTQTQTHTPIHKGEFGSPTAQGLRGPLCSTAANQDHLLPCFFSSNPLFFSSFLPLFSCPLPFLSGLWQLYIILFQLCWTVGRESACVWCVGGSPEAVRGFDSLWLMGGCRLCSLIHHILYLGFREEEKEKGGQRGVLAPPKISDRWARRAFSTPLSPSRNRRLTLVTQHHSAVSEPATKDR